MPACSSLAGAWLHRRWGEPSGVVAAQVADAFPVAYFLHWLVVHYPDDEAPPSATFLFEIQQLL
eukprot:15879474-Heterocapsa_arctica.AAC.1